MSSDPVRLKELFEKYIRNSCSKQEMEEFWRLLSAPEENGMLREQLEALWQQQDTVYSRPGKDKQQIFERILEKARERKTGDAGIHRVYRRRVRMAAAVLIAIVAAGFWLAFQHKHPVSSAAISRSAPASDAIHPGGNKAILTLAGGKTIVLDSARRGQLASLAGTRVIKVDSGLLAYKQQQGGATGADHGVAVKYNMLRTPRGGQYRLVLPDGSKVWLNAASSVRFPTAFTGKERMVEITGEAYFEIAQNAAKPFFVRFPSAPGGGREGIIQVLGTHFNINAYEDEARTTVTLLEGAVRVSQPATRQSRVVGPGEAVQIDKGGDIKLVKHADTEEAVAWKNGKFIFDGADIGTVMRQIARWYDVDVEYRGKIAVHFGGRIQRSADVSDVFKMLELTGAVEFRIEGRKVVVRP